MARILWLNWSGGGNLPPSLGIARVLTERGHELVVYCRPHVVDPKLRRYKGAELVHLRTVQNKYLDTFVHTFLSAIHAGRVTKPDVALFFIAGNSPLCLITRWASIPAVINVDGLDSEGFAKAALEAKEGCPVSKALTGVTITLDAALNG